MIIITRESITYCGKDKEGRYVHFFQNKTGVRLCGHDEFYSVYVRECKPGENNTHWSWWDNKCQQFQFTHYKKAGVTICFPYSIKMYEENGEGELLPVIVELI